MKQSSDPILRAPIVAIVIFQIAALFTRTFLESRLIASGEPKPFAQDLSYLVVPPILIVLMYPILRQHGPYLRSLLRRQDLALRLVVLSVLLGITLRMTYWGGLISLISFGVIRNSYLNAVVGSAISFGCPEPGILALSLLVVSLLVPLIEETINRGLILQSLMRRGRFFAVVWSSVLFAIMHDPQAIVVSFLAGLFLAVQMIHYKTLWAPLVTHATYNAVVVLDWECISVHWNPIETTPAMIGTGLIAMALAAVGISLSLYLARKKGIAAPEHCDARTC